MGAPTGRAPAPRTPFGMTNVGLGGLASAPSNSFNPFGFPFLFTGQNWRPLPQQPPGKHDFSSDDLRKVCGGCHRPRKDHKNSMFGPKCRQSHNTDCCCRARSGSNGLGVVMGVGAAVAVGTGARGADMNQLGAFARPCDDCTDGGCAAPDHRGSGSGSGGGAGGS